MARAAVKHFGGERDEEPSDVASILLDRAGGHDARRGSLAGAALGGAETLLERA
jgi:hypothetical protein